jgi:hypothetical protein
MGLGKNIISDSSIVDLEEILTTVVVDIEKEPNSNIDPDVLHARTLDSDTVVL